MINKSGLNTISPLFITIMIILFLVQYFVASLGI
jgi:hypothetical protein